MTNSHDERRAPAIGAGHDGSLEYHHRMLADPHRVAAYDRALRALVSPGARVLDAGAGTGLLAMLAARSGAGTVYAVESMPIAALARALVAHNGLDAQVEVIEADLRALPPRGPVDLVVSDCLGRFLVDDHMLEAMQAAFAWLAPGGRVIPAEVTLVLAPIEVRHFGVVDGLARPLLGVDLGPAALAAEHQVWAGAFGPDAVLATPSDYATWRLPGPPPTFDATLAWTMARGGRLRGLAGWFRATLAPGVVLDTEPGVETHWHQLFMPLPAAEVAAGDHLEVRVWLEDDAGLGAREPAWARAGVVVQGGRARTFERRVAMRAITSGDRWRTREGRAGVDAEGLDAIGVEAWLAGDLARALDCFEDAVMALTPGAVRPGLWENLGIARHARGDWSGAVMPLLRALDGDLAAREQSLRLLVDACMRGGRQGDGARWLALYESLHGPHPAGWARASASP